MPVDHRPMPDRLIRSWWLIVMTAAWTGFSAEALLAQLPQTRLYAVFPTGGRAGTTVELQLTSGEDLEEIDRLYFNHAGITAAQKMTGSGDNQQPVANAFVVTVDEGVPAGIYELRASGLFGLSNPRAFVVSTNAERPETEPNNTFEQAGEINYEEVVSGRADSATDVDVYKFQGKQGERVIITPAAAPIDSRMMATCELYDADQRRLGYASGDVGGDPLLDVTLPADGTYFVKVYDLLYRGGADYFYRLKVGTGAHIDFVMPPADRPGSTATYTLFGRNLPGGTPSDATIDGRPLEELKVEITLPEEADTLQFQHPSASYEASLDGISYVLPTPSGPSNPVRILMVSAPVTLEQEPNDLPAQAQSIALPAELAGQFHSTGDVDFFTFEAKAKEVYFLEVFAQRSLSAADPFLILEQVTRDEKGNESAKRLTAVDDNDNNLSANVFDTRTDDPLYRFEIPADGTYRISLRDRYFETRGDPSLVYRLSVRQQQPDFRLVVLPLYPVQGETPSTATWSLGLRKGDTRGVQVLAFRRDGYQEPIDVYAQDLPPGVVCPGATIGPESNTAELIFTAAEDAPEWAGTIQVFGKTHLQDPEKVAAVTAAADALAAAKQAAADLASAAEKAAETQKQAGEQLAKAKEAAEKNPDDENLAKQLADAQQAFDLANSAAEQANAARQGGDQKQAEAAAAVEKADADRAAAARDIVREARPGTIVWSGAQNVPAVARVARALGLSVLKETAPFQIATNMFRVEANQSRQILVPVTLTKRDGFDNEVKLSVIGLPKNANVNLEAQPIAKGQTEQLLKLFVNHNARLGTYTLALKSESQVDYRRNPFAVERAKTDQQAAAKAASEAAEAAKQATAARDAVMQQLTAAQGELKKGEEAVPVAEKKIVETDTLIAKAQEQRVVTDQAAVEAAEAAEAAARVAELAKKLADEAAMKSKAAADANAAAAAQLAESKAAAEQARKALDDAKKAVEAAAETVKTRQEALAKAEAETKQADEAAKAVAAAKEAADKKVAEAEKAAAPKKVADFPLSTPIILTIKRGPATLDVTVPNNGTLKRDEQIELSVKVRRKNGFQGPVTLTLPLPPNATGLSAEPVAVPADQETGTLSVRAAADATIGKLENMVVRASMEFEGEAVVDAPVQLNVVEK